MIGRIVSILSFLYLLISSYYIYRQLQNYLLNVSLINFQTRKHMPCTAHLPLHCSFDIVEIELHPPYVTLEALQTFTGIASFISNYKHQLISKNLIKTINVSAQITSLDKNYSRKVSMSIVILASLLKRFSRFVVRKNIQ